MCCSFVYLHFVDCHHVLLSTLTHSLGFVLANHRQLSLSIFDQLCHWRWSHLLGKNVKALGILSFSPLISLILSFVHYSWCEISFTTLTFYTFAGEHFHYCTLKVVHTLTFTTAHSHFYTLTFESLELDIFSQF